MNYVAPWQLGGLDRRPAITAGQARLGGRRDLHPIWFGLVGPRLVRFDCGRWLVGRPAWTANNHDQWAIETGGGGGGTFAPPAAGQAGGPAKQMSYGYVIMTHKARCPSGRRRNSRRPPTSAISCRGAGPEFRFAVVRQSRARGNTKQARRGRPVGGRQPSVGRHVAGPSCVAWRAGELNYQPSLGGGRAGGDNRRWPATAPSN